MKQIKVLGSGCKSCQTTATLIEEVAQTSGVQIELIKVTDAQEIMASGVMKTPAVIIDGKLVHKGGIPEPETITQWLKQ